MARSIMPGIVPCLDRRSLVQALKDRDIDAVPSDHVHEQKQDRRYPQEMLPCESSNNPADNGLCGWLDERGQADANAERKFHPTACGPPTYTTMYLRTLIHLTRRQK